MKFNRWYYHIFIVISTTKFSSTHAMNMSSEVTPQAAIIKCVNFAAIKHRDQRRLDAQQTPYINHPVGVAYILTDEAKIDDMDIIQAALLHDTVEDTNTTFDEIEKEFGIKIRKIVEEVTDDKSLPKQTRKYLQIERAPTSTYEAKLVKLADKLYNLRDLEKSPPENWNEERVREYFSWAKKVVNGLRGTNKALEDSLDEVFRRNDVE